MFESHGFVWRKSSHSANNGSCVEISDYDHRGIAVRDSRDPKCKRLVFSRDEWSAFLTRIKTGALDQ